MATAKKIYLYVAAFKSLVRDEPIRFEHTFVEAESKGDAYEEGGKVLVDAHSDMQFVNDYVVDTEKR